MNDPAILARDVDFSYPPLDPALSPAAVFEALALEVAPGNALTIAGGSGSGKSTLCYLLAGLAPRYTGGRLAGNVHILDRDVVASPPGPDTLGLLFQDAATQLFNPTAEDEIAWGLEALGIPSGEIAHRVAEALHRFRLLDQRHRPPWTLSGGQQKRLALAALWAQRPRVLLLDEPLGGLDPSGQAEVRKALDLLQKEGATLLVTTPRLDSPPVPAMTALLDQGALARPAPTTDLITREEALIHAGVACPAHLWQSLADAGNARMHSHARALEVRRLRFRYPDGTAALHGLDLAIPQGQFVALVGRNGAGKTTLARHFNGLLHPTMGQVYVMGAPAAGRSIGELAREVGFLFQRPEQQIFGTTVREEVGYGPRRLGLPDADARVDRVLAQFGLTGVAEHPPAILSYGTQRAITLASLAALETPILVLDEPTVGLDGRGIAQLLAWLAERRAAGATLVVVTHEMALAAQADRVVALEEGRVIDDGPPAAVLPRLPWEMVA